MKKISKILLSISGAAAIAAPITCLTSCSNWKIQHKKVSIYAGDTLLYFYIRSIQEVESWDGWTGTGSFQLGNKTYATPIITFEGEHTVDIKITDEQLGQLSVGSHRGKLKVKLENSGEVALDKTYGVTVVVKE